MEPGIEELRKNYERFTNEKLIRIISEDASGLRPEALELLRQILKERHVSLDVNKTINAQQKKISQNEFLDYCELLRNLACPICNSTTKKLNATVTGTVISVIVVSSYRKEIKIGCPACLDKLNNNAIIKSAILGWWGLPWGIVRTPQAIILNNKMKKQNHNLEPNALFKSFVLERAGRIEANKDNAEQLNDIITYIR